MLPVPENNCNAGELLRAVKMLLDRNQYNDMLRLIASDNPTKFIDDVHNHLIALDDVLTPTGYETVIVLKKPIDNFIGAVKAFRRVCGDGLADSKVAVERLRDFKIPVIIGTKFEKEIDAVSSAMYTELCQCFVIETRSVSYVKSVYKDSDVWKDGGKISMKEFAP